MKRLIQVLDFIKITRNIIVIYFLKSVYLGYEGMTFIYLITHLVAVTQFWCYLLFEYKDSFTKYL